MVEGDVWAAGVRPRGADRRIHPRFEIVGTFLGSLEIRHPFEIRNLGHGGALVKMSASQQIGDRLRGRLQIGGRLRNVQANVRHVIGLASSPGEYLVGLEFMDDVSVNAALLVNDEQASRDIATVSPGERRRYRRVDNPDGIEFETFEWLTIELHDIGLGGLMFTAKTPLAPGDRAQLHTRLGEKRFEAEVEVRRVSQGTTQDQRAGVSFVEVHEESLRNLRSFLASSTN